MVEPGTTKTFAFVFLLLLSLCYRVENDHVSIPTESFFPNSSSLSSYSQFNLSGDQKNGISMVRNHVST